MSRKGKKEKFLRFLDSPNCFEASEWSTSMAGNGCVLEIGAGTGDFLVSLAASNLGRQTYIAIDVKADRLQKGALRAQRLGLDDVKFLRARADMLPDLLPPLCANEIWLTFSDPFPKKRSAKHRLTHPRFLAIYRRLLVSGGTLHLKTDSHELFDWSLEQIVGDGWNISALTYDLHASEFPGEYKIMTTYEAGFVAEGLLIYAFDAKKD